MYLVDEGTALLLLEGRPGDRHHPMHPSGSRTHPYHGTTRNRCAEHRLRRSPSTVGTKVKRSLNAQLCALSMHPAIATATPIIIQHDTTRSHVGSYVPSPSKCTVAPRGSGRRPMRRVRGQPVLHSHPAPAASATAAAESTAALTRTRPRQTQDGSARRLFGMSPSASVLTYFVSSRAATMTSTRSPSGSST
jgi:hypothetical protein